jgi:hypothetical protein
MFSPTDGASAAGLNYLRIPIGASDFSPQGRSSVISAFWRRKLTSNTEYSLDDASGDTSFSRFNIDKLPSYVLSALWDIKSINEYIKIHLVAWSPVRPRDMIIRLSCDN